MAIKLRSTIMVFMLFVPVLFYVLNSALFEFFMFFAVLFVCIKSLYKLFVYNFSSDEFLEKYESVVKPISLFDFLIGKLFSVILTVFITIFFIEKCIVFTGIIKYAAILAAALWIFDFLKTVYSFFSQNNYSEEYTVFDSVLEILMWIQNIVSVILMVAIAII